MFVYGCERHGQAKAKIKSDERTHLEPSYAHGLLLLASSLLFPTRGSRSMGSLHVCVEGENKEQTPKKSRRIYMTET